MRAFSPFRNPVFKALIRDRMFVFGLFLLFVLVSMALAGFVLVPDDVKTAWYLNQRWDLNPKLAPPCWVNYFSQASLSSSGNITYTYVQEYWEFLAKRAWDAMRAELVGMGITDERVLDQAREQVYSKVRSEYEGRGFSYTFQYQFESDVPPSDLAIVMVSTSRDLEVDVIVQAVRPDGAELYVTAGSRISIRKGGKSVLKLGHSADIAGKLVELFSPDHDLATLRVLKDKISHGVVSPVNVFFYRYVGYGGTISPSVPIKGSYTIRVNLASSGRLEREDVEVLLRVIGGCHGLLGTDNMGRDNLWTLLAGTATALMIGLPYALISRFIGMVYGATSGFYGGTAVDSVMQRVCEVIYAMPYLPFIIIISYTIKETTGASIGIPQIIGLLIVFGWTGTAIVTRSMALSIREEPYIESAVAIGASKARILFRHIMPQLLSYFFASVMLATPGAILTEVFLSVLGLTDPNTPSWGKMISGAQLTVHAWWWIIPPGIAITLTGLTFMFMGYAIENTTNPRRKRI